MDIVGREDHRSATHAADASPPGSGKDDGLADGEHCPGEIAGALVERLLWRRGHWHVLYQLGRSATVRVGEERHIDRGGDMRVGLDGKPTGDLCAEFMNVLRVDGHASGLLQDGEVSGA